VGFAPSSRNRLTRHDLDRFPGGTLFNRMPRKELYEAWEMARRVRRAFRGGRVVDVAGGHGLLGQIMLLLDASSSSAVVVDPELPRSSHHLHSVLTEAWPQLKERVVFVRATLADFELQSSDIVVSSHACGRLTDDVLQRAAAVRSRVAVLPCCHDLGRGERGDLAGWVDGPLAIDIERAVLLREQGYRIWTQAIPPEITPKNRLLIGSPA
jgi:hypothetical protein